MHVSFLCVCGPGSLLYLGVHLLFNSLEESTVFSKSPHHHNASQFLHTLHRHLQTSPAVPVSLVSVKCELWSLSLVLTPTSPTTLDGFFVCSFVLGSLVICVFSLGVCVVKRSNSFCYFGFIVASRNASADQPLVSRCHLNPRSLTLSGRSMCEGQKLKLASFCFSGRAF